MNYILYKTVNNVNQKFYIGVHYQEGDAFDGYLGSGLAIKSAIEKYGRESFSRTTLKIFENEIEAYLAEEQLVNPEDPLCYNMNRGGKGGWTFVNENNLQASTDYVQRNEKIKSTMLSKYGVDNAAKLQENRIALAERNKTPKSAEAIKKQSDSLKASGKQAGANNSMYGRTGELSPCYGRVGDLHPMFGKSHSADSLDKLKNNENLKKPKPKVQCPRCGKIGGNGGMGLHIKSCQAKGLMTPSSSSSSLAKI